MSERKGSGHIHSAGNFLFCLIISLALNLQGLIPAAIALILYLWLGFPPLWIVLTLAGIWFFIILIQLLVIRWAASRPSKPLGSNKNPYSSNGYVPGGNKNPYSSAGNQADDN
ncbi:MAG: hypothetical protein K2J95_08315 [Lachnospiraceae bacterium]|nr:hypothetical protein [Lachnospiraceae bacterium]